VCFHLLMRGTQVCACGHVRELHEHYRAGTDCATCGPEGCPRFRSQPRRGRNRPDAAAEIVPDAVPVDLLDEFSRRRDRSV